MKLIKKLFAVAMTLSTLGSHAMDWLEALPDENTPIEIRFAQISAQHNTFPLMAAAKQGDTTALHELLQQPEHRAHINQTDGCGRTALHLAAIFGHAACITELAQAGATIDLKDHIARTALHCAVQSQLARIGCIPGNAGLQIIQTFAPNNCPSYLYRTPLIFYYDENAINLENNEGIAPIQALLDAHANPSLPCTMHSATPLGMTLKLKDLMPRAPQHAIDAIIELLNTHHAVLSPREAKKWCVKNVPLVKEMKKLIYEFKGTTMYSPFGDHFYQKWAARKDWFSLVAGVAAWAAGLTLIFKGPLKCVTRTNLRLTTDVITSIPALVPICVASYKICNLTFQKVLAYRQNRISQSLLATATRIHQSNPNQTIRNALEDMFNGAHGGRETPATLPECANMFGIQLSNQSLH